MDLCETLDLKIPTTTLAFRAWLSISDCVSDDFKSLRLFDKNEPQRWNIADRVGEGFQKNQKTQSSCELTSERRGSLLAAVRDHLRNGSQEANWKTANSSHWHLRLNTKMQICTVSFLGPLYCLPFRFTPPGPKTSSVQALTFCLYPNIHQNWRTNSFLFAFQEETQLLSAINERCGFLWNPWWLMICGCFSSGRNGAQSHRCRQSSVEVHQIT